MIESPHRIKFVEVTMRNFLSYGNNVTRIKLDRSSSTLIVGENVDDTSAGIVSNGSGKTTILNAIVYAIYDKPLSHISKDGLVNNINNKNMEVTLSFVIDGIPYKIIRERKTKAGSAGNNTTLLIDGVDRTQAGAVNSQIEEIIGMPYELFTRIVVFSATLSSFLSLPVKHATAPNQTSFIEELFGVTSITEKATFLNKELIKQTDNQLQIMKAKIDIQEREAARFETQKSSVYQKIDRWDIDHAREISDIKKKIAELSSSSIDFDCLRDRRQQYDTLLVESTKLSNKIRTINDNITATNKEISRTNKSIEEYTTELAHLSDNTCPYCKQLYVDTNTKILETTDKITNLSESIVSLESILLELVENKADNKSQLDDINDKISELSDAPSFKVIAQMEQEPIELKNNLSSVLALSNPYHELYGELEATILDNIDYSEIDRLIVELEHQKFLHKLLTKKDSFIRKAILNKNIPYLNGRIKHYLGLLGLPYKMEFTQEMTSSITKNGKLIDHGNLSGGQMARANIALSLAFRDVLCHLHSTINLLFLDEVFDVGLDSVGIQSAAKLVRAKAKEEQLSMYVITHREELIGACDSVLTVRMEKGFSSIIEQG